MPAKRKGHLLFLALLLASLGLATEARADVVELTLSNTNYDLTTGSFILTGFFTNSGSASFSANRWDISFAPDLGPLGIGANTMPPNCCPFARPVPGMSTSPVLPLLDISFHGTTVRAAGTYIGTVSFSGFDSNGMAITTTPVQFTVNVPVPEPATILLLGSGLIAVGSSIRRRRNALKK